MKSSMVFTCVLLAFWVAACGAAGDLQATVQADVSATLAGLPPEVVTVEVPVEMPVTVEVPITVEVPVTVEVVVEATAIPATAPAETAPPTATTAPRPVDVTIDALAGTSATALFDEDFTFPEYWEEFDDASARGAIEDGQYVLTIKLTERLNWTFNARRGADFYYQGVASVGSCKAGDNYGLVFRVVDNFNFYSFGTSCDGKYRLLRYVDGLFEEIVPWTSSAAINKLEATNVLGVRAEGAQISLYANDQFLTGVTDDSFSEGRFGMYVGSRLTPNLTASFDEIVAYPIPSSGGGAEPGTTTGATQPALSDAPVEARAGASAAPLFDEDFNFPDYWEEFDDATARGAILDDQYTLTVKRTERLNWAFNARKGTDFYFQGSATVGLCKAGDNYGLVFRVVDSFNFYAFGVSCDGNYRLLRYENGSFTAIIPWTATPAVRKLESTNVLGVRAAGNEISLYVNDQFLVTVTEDKFREGRFGMYVGSRLTPNLTVVFDDLVAYPVVS